MIDPQQLRLQVIRPALKHIGAWSQSAEELIMGTAAQESLMGRYLRQLGGGPARGIFQMEPATRRDCDENYLSFRPELEDRVKSLLAPWQAPDDQLCTNLAYAAAMCRVRYLRAPGALPAATDLDGLAAYWKAHYNTHLGAGTVNEFKHHYRHFVEGSE